MILCGAPLLLLYSFWLNLTFPERILEVFVGILEVPVGMLEVAVEILKVLKWMESGRAEEWESGTEGGRVGE